MAVDDGRILSIALNLYLANCEAALANLLLMSRPSFGEFSGVETAGESIRSHIGGALLSGHAFQKIESPGSGWAVREKANLRGAAESC
jgi:hypothetical protein